MIAILFDHFWQITAIIASVLGVSQAGYIGHYPGYASPILSFGYSAPNYVAAPYYNPSYSHGYKPEPIDYYVSLKLNSFSASSFLFWQSFWKKIVSYDVHIDRSHAIIAKIATPFFFFHYFQYSRNRNKLLIMQNEENETEGEINKHET